MKPMLAATVTRIEDLRYPLLASSKLDGVRAIAYHGQLLSRNFKPIPNKEVQEKFSKLPHGLDGELIVGKLNDPKVFQRTVSQIMSHNGGAVDVSFNCFDDFSRPVPFKERLAVVPIEYRLEHVQIRSAKELTLYEESIVRQGFEGVILRDPYGKYKEGRSTLREQGMVKMKRFRDAEAQVVDMVEQMHNGNEAKVGRLGQTERSSHKANLVPMDMLGALVVVWEGKQFQIGTGFTAEQRKAIWENGAKGKWVKFKYLPAGMKELPRHPVFLGFRPDIDR